MQRVTYEIREIDAFGDAIDIVCAFHGQGAKQQADKAFHGYAYHHDAAVAAVLERVTAVGDELEGVQDMEYETIAKIGDAAALADGGW